MELKRVNDSSKDKEGFLLIVPYGIETYPHKKYHPVPDAFNRTLWN